MKRELPGGGTIDDRRSADDIAATAGFVVANDSFMSGWGQATGRSLFAVPFRSMEEARIVEENMRDRTEMKYVRVVGPDYRPRLYPGDHLSIRDCSDASRFYVKGGFCRCGGAS